MTRAQKLRKLVQYYVLNPSSDPIMIYEGLDVEKIEDHEFDLGQFPQKPLGNMKQIKGSVHDLLPQLYKDLSHHEIALCSMNDPISKC